MTISSYTELKAAVASYLSRSDLTSQIVDFIALAESDINTQTRLRDQETTATITMVAGQQYNSLPSGFIDLLDGDDILYDDTLKKIEIVNKTELSRYKTSTQRRPQMCYIGNRIDYDSPPDSAYTVTVPYLKGWDIETDTTNWLLTNHPGAYLYGALAQAEPFIMNDQRIPMWKALFQEKIDLLNNLSSRVKNKVKLRMDAPITESGRYNVYTDQ